jgi:cell division protein FtsA
VDNLKRLLLDVNVECADAAFGGFCSALAVLSMEQRRTGSVVIDLGGGTTDFVIYKSGLVRLAGSIAVGGDHLTADLSSGLSLNRRQAEALKKEHGSAMINRMEGDQNISLPREDAFPGKLIRASAVQAVIKARMEETFELIAEQIEEAGLSGMLGGGVVLTGGGASLTGVSDLARKVFNAPAQIGSLQNCIGIPSKKEGARFASVIGCIRYASLQQAEHETEPKTIRQWISKFLGRSND